MSAIVISPKDNVAIVLRDIAKGEQLEIAGKMLTAEEKIPFTHKIALTDIPAGAAVIKYGEKVAVAAEAIKRGQWVHVHNLLKERSEE